MPSPREVDEYLPAWLLAKVFNTLLTSPNDSHTHSPLQNQEVASCKSGRRIDSNHFQAMQQPLFWSTYWKKMWWPNSHVLRMSIVRKFIAMALSSSGALPLLGWKKMKAGRKAREKKKAEPVFCVSCSVSRQRWKESLCEGECNYSMFQMLQLCFSLSFQNHVFISYYTLWNTDQSILLQKLGKSKGDSQHFINQRIYCLHANAAAIITCSLSLKNNDNDINRSFSLSPGLWAFVLRSLVAPPVFF